jgi:hypothetical protein
MRVIEGAAGRNGAHARVVRPPAKEEGGRSTFDMPLQRQADSVERYHHWCVHVAPRLQRAPAQLLNIVPRIKESTVTLHCAETPFENSVINL